MTLCKRNNGDLLQLDCRAIQNRFFSTALIQSIELNHFRLYRLIVEVKRGENCLTRCATGKWKINRFNLSPISHGKLFIRSRQSRRRLKVVVVAKFSISSHWSETFRSTWLGTFDDVSFQDATPPPRCQSNSLTPLVMKLVSYARKLFACDDNSIWVGAADRKVSPNIFGTGGSFAIFWALRPNKT